MNGSSLLLYTLHEKLKRCRSNKTKDLIINDITNLVHDILGDDVKLFGIYETEYNTVMRLNGGRVYDKKFLDPKEEKKDAYTHIVNFRKEKRDHRNKVDWASTTLSGSKVIMYEVAKIVGQNEIIYGDTDSNLMDGVHALNPKIEKLIHKKGTLEDNSDLGGFKSDFEPKMNDGSFLKAINPEIGLEAIISVICGKKQYCNHILGWHQDGYMTISLKKRAKGVNGYHIHTEEYIRMLITGESYKQIVTNCSKLKTQNHRGIGLKNIQYQEKEIKAEQAIGNLLVKEIKNNEFVKKICSHSIINKYL